jgi:hypothetical protein
MFPVDRRMPARHASTVRSRARRVLTLPSIAAPIRVSMRASRRVSLCVLVGASIAVSIAVSACGFGFEDSKGVRPKDGRLVYGKMRPPSPMLFTRQPLALELVAASLDARADEPVLAFYSGTPFSPAANGGLLVSFRLAIPSRRVRSDGSSVPATVVMFFQVPVDRGNGIGHLIAPLRFARNASGKLTDLLYGKIGTSAVPMKDLDLGTVEMTLATRPAPPAGGTAEATNCRPTYQVLLGEGESNNPLKINDADGDGIPDFDDPDTNKDMIPDELEVDADQDAVPDVAQSLDALPDGEGCGVPDRFR